MKNVNVLFLFFFIIFPIYTMELASLPNPNLPRPDICANQIFHDARCGNVDRIRYFESNDVNKQDSKGYNPLHYACFSGSIETVKTLVQFFSADVSVENSVGKLEFKQDLRQWKGKIATPLHCAVMAGSVEIVQFLLDKRAEIDSDYQKDGSTPLHLAAWFNFPQIAQLLIERGANINKLNICGSSSVHSAAWRNSTKTLKVLLNHDAKFTERNLTGNGNTPLYLAAKAGSVKCLRILLAKDTDKKCLNLVCSGIGDNVTSLEVTIARNHYQCCWDLICAGAQLSCLNTPITIDILNKRPMLQNFLKNIESMYDLYGVYLDTIRLDEKYISCDICSKNYKENDVVIYLPFHSHNSHTFHDACFWKACYDKYYESYKEHDFFKKNSKEEAEFELRLITPEDKFLNLLQLCPKQGCNKRLSFYEKNNRIMKVYNPTLKK